MSRLVFSRFFDIRGNLGNVKEKPFIFPLVHWLRKSDYSSLVKHKIVNKTNCRTSLPNPSQLCAQWLERFLTVFMTFARLSVFSDLFDKIFLINFKPFVPNAPFLYPWKHQKTVRCIGNKWVKFSFDDFQHFFARATEAKQVDEFRDNTKRS